MIFVAKVPFRVYRCDNWEFWQDIILMCQAILSHEEKPLYWSWFCSFVITQKNQLSAAISWVHKNFIQMYASVKARDPNKLGWAWELGNLILTAREAGGLLHTCPAVLPSSTSVVKFLLGRPLHPDIFDKIQIYVPHCCPKWKSFQKGTA